MEREPESHQKADFALYEVKNDKDKPLGYHPRLFYYITNWMGIQILICLPGN
ncbi:MAG: hypothetical protein IJT16_15180 [Lachnospiraceae bacterium]|nr:hypothetical protein [Lachnospiraceae bacterium]